MHPGRRRIPAPRRRVRANAQPGERIVFVVHFERGFGLPASPFFRAFLNRFHLQPHYLAANTVMQLSTLAAFSEGYLGLWPTVELWAKYF